MAVQKISLYKVHQDNLEIILNAIHQPYPESSVKYRERLLVQEAIMEIIGRLNAVNAAETMPQIRHMINDLWTELKHPDPKICQPGARLLQVNVFCYTNNPLIFFVSNSGYVGKFA